MMPHPRTIVGLMDRTSAGILLFRRLPDGRLQVLLGHPGGPFFARRDLGSWSIPKGEAQAGEELYDVARREFAEETGHAAPDAAAIPLGTIVQKGGKRVHAWALEGDVVPEAAISNTFSMVWPPIVGRLTAFPELDRVAWFEPAEARRRLKEAQWPFVDRLERALEVAAAAADAGAEPGAGAPRDGSPGGPIDG